MKKEVLPNLKMSYEKFQEDVEKYNYYKEINDVEGEYKKLKKEYYYLFLLSLLKEVDAKFNKPYRGENIRGLMSISKKYSTHNPGIFDYIESFLTSYKLGKIEMTGKDPFEHYYKIDIICDFEDLFKALYSEIQFMEYYEEDKRRKI